MCRGCTSIVNDETSRRGGSPGSCSRTTAVMLKSLTCRNGAGCSAGMPGSGDPNIFASWWLGPCSAPSHHDNLQLSWQKARATVMLMRGFFTSVREWCLLSFVTGRPHQSQGWKASLGCGTMMPDGLTRALVTLVHRTAYGRVYPGPCGLGLINHERY